MKVRKGFVSNSSSSSFMIYGYCASEGEIKKRLRNGKAAGLKKLVKEHFKEHKASSYYKNETLKEFMFVSDYDFFELLECVLDLEIHQPPDDDYYIGKSWDSMNDDQTKKEFETYVEKRLKELFGEDISVSTLQESWYNG